MSEKVAKLRHFLMTYNFNQLPKPYRLLAMGFSGQLLRMIESEQDKEKLEEGINEFLDSLKIFANIIDSGHLPPDLEQRLDNKNLTVVKNLLAKTFNSISWIPIPSSYFLLYCFHMRILTYT